MRSKERLDTFYNKLKKIHQEDFCDWRFGQLCNNFFRWLQCNKNVNFFYIEEDEMLKYFNQYRDEVIK